MLEERERSIEAKFAHDESVRFAVQARRAKLFGLWAAHRRQQSGLAAHDYALGLVTDLDLHGDEALLHRVGTDLIAAGSPVPVQELATALQMATARAVKIVIGRGAPAA